MAGLWLTCSHFCVSGALSSTLILTERRDFLLICLDGASPHAVVFLDRDTVVRDYERTITITKYTHRVTVSQSSYVALCHPIARAA